LLTLLSFVAALCILIAVHELGHYLMARACGVGVIKFSIGFGPSFLKWRNAQGTEFVLSAFPLGGFVQMVDERETPVDSGNAHLAFNRKSVSQRFMVVAAGPLANLMLATLLYATVACMGQWQPAPLLSTPTQGSMADTAGLRAGQRVTSIAFEGHDLQPIQSFEELRWWITRAAMQQENLQVERQDASGAHLGGLVLPLARLAVASVDSEMFQSVGIVSPMRSAVLREVKEGGPGYRAGLKAQDVVLRIDGQPIQDASHLQQLIKALPKTMTDDASLWSIDRQGVLLQLEIRPDVVREDGADTGRVGVWVGGEPHMAWVQSDVLSGLWSGLVRTWEVSALTVNAIFQMLTGEASLKNLSGPLSMAEYAGQSAQIGLASYVLYLALISVSIGILNLLPIPVLDGGHLVFLMCEAVLGKPLPESWQGVFQKGGLLILMVMMSLSLFNDVTRFFHG